MFALAGASAGLTPPISDPLRLAARQRAGKSSGHKFSQRKIRRQIAFPFSDLFCGLKRKSNWRLDALSAVRGV
jgi:hypothetical protein